MTEQAIDPGGHHLGQRQQPHGVPAGGGVEDDQVVARSGGRHQLGDPLEQGRFGGARRVAREVQLAVDLVVQPRMYQLFHLGLDRLEM